LTSIIFELQRKNQIGLKVSCYKSVITKLLLNRQSQPKALINRFLCLVYLLFLPTTYPLQEKPWPEINGI